MIQMNWRGFFYGIGIEGVIKGIAYVFAILFIYAATSKLLDFETFTVQLAQSPLLSAYAGIIAWLVPGIEILIAGLLVFSRLRNVALYAAFTLMVMFTAYIYIILNFSDFVPCSCGGVLEELSWTQHLIFNVVFIVLGAVAILISRNGTKKKKLFLLASLCVLGIGIVTMLFVFSEKKMQRNNAFQRRYIPDVLEYYRDYELGTNNYYISGFKNNIIYLGNYQAPLYLKTLTISLDTIKDFPVSISNMELPYRRARMVVKPPYFYVGDGTVPVIFRGSIRDWKASVLSYDNASFKQFEIADSTRIGIASIYGTTGSTMIGLISKSLDRDTVFFNTTVITKQVDGIFDSDGVLLWNARHKKWIYTYYYRNSYEVTNESLEYEFSGKTIDTISKAVLDISHHIKKDQFKRGGNSIVVNRHTATYGNYLYVNSDRLGRYEDIKAVNSASIIDIYNIMDNRYEFSFYLSHQPDKKLVDFRIDKDYLLAIVDGRLWIYKLKPKYFNSGSNTTHTGQYQD
ncbi:DoxX family protein [Aequorivita sp. 609]|uniref:DoxX family protein n=1 Tax=Aequorivita TaxID=153265 RepID=UPI00161E1BE4|nr:MULTISPECIES: DoxX family protein [Aequorivita]MBB6681369.1 DoxX family protein [Aequorivita sp. 609]